VHVLFAQAGLQCLDGEGAGWRVWDAASEREGDGDCVADSVAGAVTSAEVELDTVPTNDSLALAEAVTADESDCDSAGDSLAVSDADSEMDGDGVSDSETDSDGEPVTESERLQEADGL
jgi:hypothetical protein